MGVRGLTTFIAQKSDRYLRRYELHDTYLVVDGNNLAFQLYAWHCKCNDCFGGDYDCYAQTVNNFFNKLRQCNVIPLVIFDGGYEDRKLKTVYSRIKTRIKQARLLNSVTEASMKVFPLFIRELFCEIVLNLSLKVVRCVSEADFEMACIARKLNCPLLSYDSDFYIFDVKYIPFNTLTLAISQKSKDSYKYLECKIYNIDYFLRVYRGLKKDCIPLLGVLLGNDYIRIGVFRNFYKHLKILKSKSGNDQQRRIKSLIAWLQNESFDSAVRKVLGRTKQSYRGKVADQIVSLANGYICSESELLEYLDVECPPHDKIETKVVVDLNNIEDQIESDTSDSDDDEKSEGSESECEIDALIADEIGCLDLPTLPEHFVKEYKNCRYPASIIDMISHNRYIFIPIIEDFHQPQCHNISLHILSAIVKIVNPRNARRVKYILRNERGRMAEFKLPESTETLPTLDELGVISRTQSLKYITDLLKIDEGFSKVLDRFPSSWKLFIVCLIYWIRNNSTNVSKSSLYSLLISAVILKSVGIRYYRNEMRFKKTHKKDILRIENNPVASVTNSTMKISSILSNIPSDEKIITMSDLIPNFHMMFKLRGNPKMFDRGIVHTFAEFQSCAYHIKYLNAVLNRPFEDYLISDFYNGTLIYNLTENFLTRPQLDLYVSSLLKRSPNIYNAFIAITDCVKSCFIENLLKNPIVKRRRKKKNKTVVKSVGIEDQLVDVGGTDDDEDIYDENNKFSALKLLD